MSLHRVRNLLEARDVRTDDQARQDFARITFLHAKLSASLKGRPEDALHDPLEPAVDLLERPGEPGRVLRHLETRDGDTAAVARLTGSVPDGLFDTLGTSGFEDVDRLLGAALERRIRVGLYEKSIALTHHVGTLSNDSDAGSDESLGFRLGDLVLGGTGQGDIRLLDEQPRTLAWTGKH